MKLAQQRDIIRVNEHLRRERGNLEGCYMRNVELGSGMKDARISSSGTVSLRRFLYDIVGKMIGMEVEAKTILDRDIQI